jgi:hypothetical protein
MDATGSRIDQSVLCGLSYLCTAPLNKQEARLNENKTSKLKHEHFAPQVSP